MHLRSQRAAPVCRPDPDHTGSEEWHLCPLRYNRNQDNKSLHSHNVHKRFLKNQDIQDDESKMSTLRMIRDEEILLQVLKQGVFDNQRYYSRIGALLSENGIKELLSSGVITDGYTIVSLLSQIDDDQIKLDYIRLLKGNKKVAKGVIIPIP